MTQLTPFTMYGENDDDINAVDAMVNKVWIVHMSYLCATYFSDMGYICPWKYLVEGDEGLYRVNCQKYFGIVLHELSLLFCNFMKTTPYHLGQHNTWVTFY